MHNLRKTDPLDFNRRRFVERLSAIGLGTTLLPGTLLSVAQDAGQVTPEMVGAASQIAGLALDESEQKRVADALNRPNSLIRNYEQLRQVELGNAVPPALVFNPIPAGKRVPTESRPFRLSSANAATSTAPADLPFLPVTHLAELLRSRQVTSTQLTQLFLRRLKRYDPTLKCVVTLTEDLALEQARRADAEIAGGQIRSPLHGIPYGIKDLFAVPGYPTTWGASPYQNQVLDLDATVYERLHEAGAVLVAKLTSGALAIGDRWFGGQTKSPWDPDNATRGSSGSSAGPASALAGGLVAFAIGTETRGSIISPSRRCGVTGLRPTFGRVSRFGAMTLSWSMDKVGPMCRTAEDCAVVLANIQGPDGRDNSLIDVPFNWDAGENPEKLKVGYLSSLMDPPREFEDAERTRVEKETREATLAMLAKIRELGCKVTQITLPKLPNNAISFILSTESAAAFDELVRGNRDLGMRESPENSVRPDRFRLHRTVPAVEYINANRVRTIVMRDFDPIFDDIDLFIGSELGITNNTGHPELTLPVSFDSKRQPLNLSLTGKLFGETELLTLAHALQKQIDAQFQRPPLTNT